MKRIQLLLIMLSLAGLSYAQKENNFWAMGFRVGLDFSSGTAVPVKANISSLRGSAAVSDPLTGKLLFYSDGDTVWNSKQVHMPNGVGLEGNWEADPGDPSARINNTAQGVCIVPFVNDPNKYYLFSLQSGAGEPFPLSEGNLYYSVIDMQRNGGLGDVDITRKNIKLATRLGESMIAVPGNSCNDVWLLVNVADTGLTKAFHITEKGIDTNAVVSYTGKGLDGTGVFRSGQFAISPDRTKLALSSLNVMHYGLPFLFNPNAAPNGAMVCSFDPWTGKVAEPIVLRSKLKNPLEEFMATGLCFSPDGSKLYASYLSREPGDLYFIDSVFQYDLSTYTPTAVVASKKYNATAILTDLATIFERKGDKIYVNSPDSRNTLDVINSPNLAGAACNYQAKAIQLPIGTQLGNSMPTMVSRILNRDTVYAVRMDKTLCTGWESGVALVATKSLPELNTTYVWDNGDTSAERQVSSEGKYWVRYVNSCHFGVDTFLLHGGEVYPEITVNEFELGTVLTYKTYQWLLDGKAIAGATQRKYLIKANGAYTVTVTNEYDCSATSSVFTVDNYTGVGAIQSLATTISIYPNPAEDRVYLKSPVPLQVEISSIEGKQVRVATAASHIDIHDLAPGIYLLRISQQDGTVLKVEKLIKSR